MFELVEDDGSTTAKLLELMLRIPTAGKQVHDANIGATMLAHGIPRLLTFNVTGFRRFEAFIAIEPLP
jgi:predicted nucleic acid-binding protein